MPLTLALLMESKPILSFVDTLTAGSFRPVKFTSTGWTLTLAELKKLTTNIRRHMLAILAEVKRAEVLSRLVDAI